MTNFEIVGLGIIIVAICLVIGYLRGDHKDSEYIKLTGFLILIIMGLFQVISPISFKNGFEVNTTVTGSTTTSTITQSYITPNTNLDFFISFGMMLLGMYGSYLSVTSLFVYDENKARQLEDDE